MTRFVAHASTAIAISFVLNASASASPTCVSQDKQAFELAGDTIQWAMTIAPGADCIQGVRWSYMQIYGVAILKPATKGRVVIVGSGFRYFADSENQVDSFTLQIFGKNRHDPGKSILEVVVKRPAATLVSELPQRP